MAGGVWSKAGRSGLRASNPVAAATVCVELVPMLLLRLGALRHATSAGHIGPQPHLLSSGLYRRLRWRLPSAWEPLGSADTRRARAADRSWARPLCRGRYHRSGITPCPEGATSLAASGFATLFDRCQPVRRRSE